jgi:hypothetical protein
LNSPGREGTRRETTGWEGLECERERKRFDEWEENLRKSFISIRCRYNKHLFLEKKFTQRANNSKVNKENNKVWEVRWLSGFRFFFFFVFGFFGFLGFGRLFSWLTIGGIVLWICVDSITCWVPSIPGDVVEHAVAIFAEVEK